MCGSVRRQRLVLVSIQAEPNALHSHSIKSNRQGPQPTGMPPVALGSTEARPDPPPAPPASPPSAAATAATVLLGLAVLFLSSWLTNRRFGHATYHRGAPIEEGKEGEHASEPPHRPPPRAAAPPPPPPTGAGRGRPLLQEALPPEIMVDQILPFLDPFEVVTGAALCSRACWAAAEAPGLWTRFARRAGLTAELLSAQGATAARRGGGMIVVEGRGGGGAGAGQQEQEQSHQPQGERPPLEEVKGKLEFFRRAFLLPYALTKGHGSAQSCRVVVHGAAYDVTFYLGNHPGGEAILLEYGGGVDATTVFELALHSAQARRKMREFLLWDPASPSCLGAWVGGWIDWWGRGGDPCVPRSV